MIIDCVADLHGHYPKLEGGDLLIIAGDLTAKDTHAEWIEYLNWLSVQKYEQIIYITGNHDNTLEIPSKCLSLLDDPGIPQNRWAEEIIYLYDSGTDFEGFKIWGSPWTQSFEGMNPKCKAFTFDTDKELAEKWALIPDDIDILITHSPPYGIFDEVKDYYSGKIESVGSKTLLKKSLDIKPKLKLHVFGHIHENYGQMTIANRIFINASLVNEYYKPVNKPIRIIL